MAPKDIGLTEHADKPFKVSGILERTGCPVDRSVHVSLEAIEAIHLDWQGGAPMPGAVIPAEYVRKFDLAPKEITAVLIGLKSRAGVFQVQRFINQYKGEPCWGASRRGAGRTVVYRRHCREVAVNYFRAGGGGRP